MKHVVVVFHECRWTPGAAKDGEFSSGRGQRLFDKGNPKLLVVVDAEGLQFLVAFVDIGVAATREIATVNVGSGQRVTDAVVGIEIGIEDFLLFSWRQFGKRFSGGIGKCAADAQDRLKCLSGIDKDTDLSFQRLAQMFECQRVGSREAVISVVSGGIDRYFSAFDSALDLERL